MTKPLVSILIPCYNAERWIAQCIESALAQTYAPVEIVVVDDGSTDGSADIVKSFGSKVRHELRENAGANATRNRLLEMAHGEWLQYLDADDYLLPEKVEQQMGPVRARDAEVDVVFSPVRVRWEASGTEEIWGIDPSADPELNFIRWAPLNTNSVLWRRSRLAGVGGWKNGQPCCQEHELFLRFIMAGARFELVEYSGAIYRMHGSDTISHRDPHRVVRIKMSLTDQMEAYLEKTGRKTFRHEEALYIARLEAARSVYRLDKTLARQFYEKAVAGGRRLVRSSPALRMSYQLAMTVASLEGAETMASWWRRGKRIMGTA